jgi:MFS family permease
MIGGEIKLLAAGFLLAFASSFGQTFFIALFGGEIRAEFGLSHRAFGSIYSLATLASGVLMLWVGAALDRVSLRSYAAAAVAALAAACLLMAVIDTPWLLMVALFGLRLAGQGMMSHASITGMARAFLRHRGKAIALATLGHPAGEAVLPILAVSAAAAFGWRNVWLGAAGVLVLAFPLLSRLLGRGDKLRPVASGATAGQAEARSYTRAAMLRDGRFYLLMPALIGPSFIVTGLFFHQVHLTEAKGWELSWFATCFAAYAAASTAALMLAGTLIDRLGAIPADADLSFAAGPRLRDPGTREP